MIVRFRAPLHLSVPIFRRFSGLQHQNIDEIIDIIRQSKEERKEAAEKKLISRPWKLNNGVQVLADCSGPAECGFNLVLKVLITTFLRTS